jgi:hypothetical protein
VAEPVTAAVEFPLLGVDTAFAPSLQRPRTTPVGTNARSQDPFERRLRGGSRTGLIRWIDERVNGVNEIQCLDVVVTAGEESTLYCADHDGGPGPRMADPSTNNTGRVPAGGRTVRVGGSGVMLLRVPCAGHGGGDAPELAQVASDGVAGQSGTSNELAVTLPGSSAAGNTVVVAVLYGDTNTPTVTSVEDSTGATYAQVGRVGGGAVQTFLDVWVVRLAAGGANTVTVTLGTTGGEVCPGLRVIVAEYAGVRAVTPVSADASDAATYTNQISGTADPGELVAAQDAAECYVAFFGLPNVTVYPGGTYTPSAGSTERERHVGFPPGAAGAMLMTDSTDPAVALPDPVRPTLAWDSDSNVLSGATQAFAVALHS